MKYGSQFPYSGPLFVQFKISFSLIHVEYVTTMCLFENSSLMKSHFCICRMCLLKFFFSAFWRAENIVVT